MALCGLRTKEPSLNPVIASERAHGGNVHWVLREFPRQSKACRQRSTRARTLLIVVIDADDNTIEERCRQLNNALQHDGLEPLGSSDPLAVLIPKRHIETWIRAATVGGVNENDDYKKPSPTGEVYVKQRSEYTHGQGTAPSQTIHVCPPF